MLMKRHSLVLGFLLSLFAVVAKDYNSYYLGTPIELQQVKSPAIPDRTLSISDCGGVGDGVTLCTEAFRLGIQQLSEQGGGRLVVPQGIWLTGPIELKSNIDLHLEKNALVIFSPDKSLYRTGDGSGRYLPLIGGNHLHDVSITGQGTLDGNGKYWRPVKRGKMSDEEWKQYNYLGGYITEKGDLWLPYNLKGIGNETTDESMPVEKRATREENLRNDLVRINNSCNLLFEGVTFQNAPRFHVHPIVCENVIMDGITVRCPWNAQNGDAIDLANVRRALVVNCTVDAGDDGICMKGGTGQNGVKQGPCQDILIQDNTIWHGHGGFVIGSDVSGGMDRIVVRNCTMSGTDVGLRFKSGLGRGGLTKDIYCYDIVMNDVKNEAVIFDCTYMDMSVQRQLKEQEGARFEVKEASFPPAFQDIHIWNTFCHECKTGIKGTGLSGLECVKDIDIHDCVFYYTGKASDIDANCQVRLESVTFVGRE